MIPTPGAKTSKQVPQLEKEALRSVESLAPTVKAFVADAGDVLHASAFSFPAATAKGIPAATALSTALFSVVDLPPPKDMDATAGFLALAVTQLIPLITP